MTKNILAFVARSYLQQMAIRRSEERFFIDLSGIDEKPNLKIFHAGTKISNGTVRVTGGRILSVNTCCV